MPTCRQARPKDAVRYVADGQRVNTVKSGLQRLKERQKSSLAQYSEQCGVPKRKLSRWRKPLPVTDVKLRSSAHGGMMAGNGFYNARRS